MDDPEKQSLLPTESELPKVTVENGIETETPPENPEKVASELETKALDDATALNAEITKNESLIEKEATSAPEHTAIIQLIAPELSTIQQLKKSATKLFTGFLETIGARKTEKQKLTEKTIKEIGDAFNFGYAARLKREALQQPENQDESVVAEQSEGEETVSKESLNTLVKLTAEKKFLTELVTKKVAREEDKTRLAQIEASAKAFNMHERNAAQALASLEPGAFDTQVANAVDEMYAANPELSMMQNDAAQSERGAIEELKGSGAEAETQIDSDRTATEKELTEQLELLATEKLNREKQDALDLAEGIAQSMQLAISEAVENKDQDMLEHLRTTYQEKLTKDEKNTTGAMADELKRAITRIEYRLADFPKKPEAAPMEADTKATSETKTPTPAEKETVPPEVIMLRETRRTEIEARLREIDALAGSYDARQALGMNTMQKIEKEAELLLTERKTLDTPETALKMENQVKEMTDAALKKLEGTDAVQQFKELQARQERLKTKKATVPEKEAPPKIITAKKEAAPEISAKPEIISSMENQIEEIIKELRASKEKKPRPKLTRTIVSPTPSADDLGDISDLVERTPDVIPSPATKGKEKPKKKGFFGRPKKIKPPESFEAV